MELFCCGVDFLILEGEHLQFSAFISLCVHSDSRCFDLLW
jgi:hypothetical protein